jgi:hypothetical protein
LLAIAPVRPRDLPATDPLPRAPAPPTPVSPRYDVATVDEATLERLGASSDLKDRALSALIREARLSYADYLLRGAHVTVLTSSGNGGFPVLVLTGPGFDPRQPADVHTHYHGFVASVTDRLGDPHRAQLTMRERQAENPQLVFVLPECRNAVRPALPQTPSRSSLDANDDRAYLQALAGVVDRAPQETPYYKTDWNNVSSQAKTTEDALAAAGITRVARRTVSAHSGGGTAIALAMQADLAGDPAGGVRADRLELLDCFYDSEKTIAKWASTPAATSVAHVVYVHASNTQTDAFVAAAFKERYERVESKPVADNPIAKNPDGTPIKVNKKPLTRYADKPDTHVLALDRFLHSAPALPSPIAFRFIRSFVG